METDRRDAAAFERAIERRIEAFPQCAEFVVHRDPQRLKRARRRVQALAFAADMHDAGDEGGEFRGVARLALLDGARDLPRGAFLAELEDDVGQLALAAAGDELRGALAVRRIEPHIKRRRGTKRKAAFGIIKLE